MLSSGLQSPLLGLRATFEGFGTDITGLIMAGYFAGFAIGSLLASKLVRRVGHVRVFAALASLASVVPLLHGMIIDPYFWFIGRLITGFSYAGIFVVTESWLNDRATNKTRGTLLSIYMITNCAAMALGPLLLNFSTPLKLDLFIISSVLVSLALIPILLAASPAPNIIATEKIKIAELFNHSPLGAVGIILTGVSNGALVGMGAIYAESLGLSLSESSYFVALLFIGGVLFQFPIGILSDYFDRRFIIIIITTCAALVPLSLIIMKVESTLVFMITFFIFGGLSLSLYSLCASHANDHLSSSQMVAANGTIVLILGAGATLGPPLASLAMITFGADGFLLAFIIIHTIVGAYGIFRMTRRKSLPLEEQGNVAFTPQPATISPIFDPKTVKASHTAPKE